MAHKTKNADEALLSGKLQAALKAMNGKDLNPDESLELPKPVMRRVNALKNLQIEMIDIEAKFYEELHKLECKYASLYEPLFDKRVKIVSGEHEPTDDEAKWIYDDDEKEQEDKENGTKKENEEKNEKIEEKETANCIGIPEFWLHVFRSAEFVSEMIQEHDEPILKHLRDVRVRMHETKPYGYTLEFHFDENEYFTNKILTKTYELSTDMDAKDPLAYDGPIIYKCKGCVIDWKKDMNVTVKQIKKKQKHKNSGTIRVITKEEKQDSFFNFFDMPTKDGMRPSFRTHMQDSTAEANGEKNKQVAIANGKSNNENEEDDDADEELCEADFELGHFFKESLIPKAVLYFTGEIVDDEASYDEEDYDDEEDEEGEQKKDEEEDEDEEEDDAEEEHTKKSNGKKGSRVPM
jgi:hypothetical protein